MLRRSARLLAQGYYDSYGQPIINYKETPYRERKRRRVRPQLFDKGAGYSIGYASIVDPDVTRSSFSRWGFLTLPLLVFLVLAYHIKNDGLPYNPTFESIQSEIRILKWKVDYLLPEGQLLPNMALTSLGAKVMLERTSVPYYPVHRFSIMCNRLSICPPVSPTVILQETSNLLPGNCWSFAGRKGFITISLPKSIPISHITLGHISKLASPHGAIPSAPKEFSIYGFKPGHKVGNLLGTFIYNKDGERFQTFELSDCRKDHFSAVKFTVHSNWGDPNYTCIYNLKLHVNVNSTQSAEGNGSYRKNHPSNV